MENHDHMKELVLAHARRVRRLWFIGACLTFCAGAIFAGRAHYLLISDDSKDTYGRHYYDSDNFREDMKAAAGVGLGFTSALIALGMFSYFVNQRFVRNGSCVHARPHESSTNAMLSSIVGYGPVALLGFIAPVRIAAFEFEEDGRSIRQTGHLFADEIPYQAGESQCWAVKFNFLGKPAAMLVCERKKDRK